MPIALLIVGIIVVLAGVKNNADEVGHQISSDFSGAGSFWYWILAVIVIGSVGYYQPAKQISHLFLALIVIVFILSNGGIYNQVLAAIQNPKPLPDNSSAAVSGGGSDPTGGAGWLVPPNKDLGFPGVINPVPNINFGTPGKAISKGLGFFGK